MQTSIGSDPSVIGNQPLDYRLPKPLNYEQFKPLNYTVLGVDLASQTVKRTLIGAAVAAAATYFLAGRKGKRGKTLLVGAGVGAIAGYLTRNVGR